VGDVGEISFWEPNRGLLITGGSVAVPAGIYAYDGSSWHELASVCGGGQGRIAWAGPDEFWTISDQRPGQAVTLGSEDLQLKLESISLCHFVDGKVVGSYAMPLDEPGSYEKMNAAACFGPSDCWFAGGTFHLHWNGSTLTTIFEPEDHTAIGMAMFDGTLYESVQIDTSDTFLPCENQSHPAVLHEIAPEGELFPCGEVESPFRDVAVTEEGVPLPRYSSRASIDGLQGMDLATDGSPLGAGATQIWAAANPQQNVRTAFAPLTILRGVLENGETRWSQILPNSHEESSLTGHLLGGSPTVITAPNTEHGVEDAIAPEPGTNSAWLSLDQNREVHGAEVVHLDAEGEFSEPDQPLILPEAGEEVGFHGEAGPIVCPAFHDCWLATVQEEAGPTPGWLFHLSDGAPIAPDRDPLFDGEDGVITYRPPDSGVPVVYPPEPPEDDSLIHQEAEAAKAAETVSHAVAGVSPPRTGGEPLLEDVKSSLLHGRTLVISFMLTARARVGLVGRRKHKVVASTRTRLLASGRHKLSLHLDPRLWPTAIQFHATPLGGSSEVPAAPSKGAEGPLAENTVETP
jgi:hypothetical protein